jgi:hypothetical protein
MQEEYIEITPENIKEIRKSKTKTGKLLISEPRFRNTPNHIIDAFIGLWNCPIFDSNKNYPFSFHVKRGRKMIGNEEWQTNWEKDRDYLLRPIPDPTGNKSWDACRELSDKLILGKYEFKISFQGAVGRAGKFSENIQRLYIPPKISIEPAFRKGLSAIVKKINQTIQTKNLDLNIIDDEAIEKIIQYVVKDYENGEIFMHNVQASVEADYFLDSVDFNKN